MEDSGPSPWPAPTGDLVAVLPPPLSLFAYLRPMVGVRVHVALPQQGRTGAPGLALGTSTASTGRQRPTWAVGSVCASRVWHYRSSPLRGALLFQLSSTAPARQHRAAHRAVPCTSLRGTSRSQHPSVTFASLSGSKFSYLARVSLCSMFHGPSKCLHPRMSSQAPQAEEAMMHAGERPGSGWVCEHHSPMSKL